MIDLEADDPDTDAVVAALRRAGCVFAEEEAALLRQAAASPGELSALVARRVDGIPLEYLVGWADFRGVRVALDPGVFVPRQRTAFLIDEALERTAARPGDRRTVVDMCCGSGALGLAATTALRDGGVDVELVAADIDTAAVACARRNLEPLGAQVFQGDLFAALPGELIGRVDLLLANTPYVPTAMIAQMPPEARDHEPRTALDGGADGLDVLRRVADAAGRWLTVGGWVLVEIGTAQIDTATAIVAATGLRPAIAESSDYGATVVCGTRTSAGS
ncbi:MULTISPECIES: putative protein N(5)-glutamine methyltransferase [Nocardia]|uniref:peptide chain release factor N(5)-glutamine methyltransferase n=2 Tax=Nocardia TaxID=1817 RepID=A0A2T2ZCU3_9NOCA|nr:MULTISPECIES: putative protein N(5)-glutamine methyltransferase [Nocardia]PSR65584.1 putative protein N(5)-glutamine methyltransferase [Nocardia nova]